MLTARPVLYAFGLYLMAYSTTPLMLTLSAGVLIGFGLSGCAFTIVVGALGKLVPRNGARPPSASAPPRARSVNFYFAARGRADRFIRLASHPDDVRRVAVGYRAAIGRAIGSAQKSEHIGHCAGQSLRHAMAEPSRIAATCCCVIGFFTCGFQLAFVTVHLPSYLLDRGLSAEIGG